MFRFLRILPVLLLAAVVGCGEREIPPDEAYAPDEWGIVDTSLPRDLQAKQQALKTVLDALAVEGIDFDTLADFDPNIQFKESAEEFLEEGTINLGRWDFRGPPTGNDVPVVLYLNKDSTGRNELKVERVYTVAGSRGRFSISRKP